MRIALVNYNHSDTVTGGVETRYRLLAKALGDFGHDCLLVSTEKQALEEILQVCKRMDLVVMDSAVGLDLDVPTITIFGNPWRSVLRLGENHHLANVLEREVRYHRRRDTYRVAVSDFMVREMSLSGLSCDRVIPNPVDTHRFDSDLQPTPFYPPTILWIGPHIAVKNPEVFQAVRDGLPESPVQWVEACRDDPANFHSYDKITEILPRCAAVLCTSWYEGCSNTLMEALAANTPIVTSATGYFWDRWDDRFGERVENPNDTQGFIIALERVLGNRSLFSPRQAALDCRLDFETWAKSWCDLVVEVADTARRNRR